MVWNPQTLRPWDTTMLNRNIKNLGLSFSGKFWDTITSLFWWHDIIYLQNSTYTIQILYFDIQTDLEDTVFTMSFWASRHIHYIMKYRRSRKSAYFSKQLRQRHNEMLSEFGFVIRNLSSFLRRWPATCRTSTDWILTSGCLLNAADHYLNEARLLSVVQC